MAQTATERLNKTKSPKVVALEKDFAGIRAGSTMFVATPKIVDECVKTIPPGRFITMTELRADLAIAYDCDATCPVSTAIFLRVAAEAALEKLTAGAETKDITPFWRVVAPGDKISSRLPVDQKWLEERRAEEQYLGDGKDST